MVILGPDAAELTPPPGTDQPPLPGGTRAPSGDPEEPSTRPGSWLTLAALVVVAAFGGALRGGGLTSQGLWRDDAWVALSGHVGIGEAWQMWATAPGTYLVDRTVLVLGSGSTIWAQMPAFVAGIAAIPATYVLARCFRLSRLAGVLMATGIALAPLCIIYSTRFKEYEVDILLSCATLAVGEVARRTPGARQLATLAVVSVVVVRLLGHRGRRHRRRVARPSRGDLAWPTAGLATARRRGRCRGGVRLCRGRPDLLRRDLPVPGPLLGRRVREPPEHRLVRLVPRVDRVAPPGRCRRPRRAERTARASCSWGSGSPSPSSVSRAEPFHARTCPRPGPRRSGQCGAGAAARDRTHGPVPLPRSAAPHRCGHHPDRRRDRPGHRRRPRREARAIAATSLVVGVLVLGLWTAHAWSVRPTYPGVDVTASAAQIDRHEQAGDHIFVSELARYPWALAEDPHPDVRFGSTWAAGFTVVSTQPDVFIVPSEYYEGDSHPKAWAAAVERDHRLWFVWSPPLSLSPSYQALLADGWRRRTTLHATGVSATLLVRP